MEEFPLNCIRDPVAVRDKNGMFNNITLFTVVEDPKNKHSPSEMHIFQVISRSVSDRKLLSSDHHRASIHLSTHLHMYKSRSRTAIRKIPPVKYIKTLMLTPF